MGSNNAKKMKKIAVIVPESAVIEAISPGYRLFKTANQFLAARGKAPLFEVEYVGEKPEISTNDGEYTIKIHRLIADVQQADLIIIPALYGEMSEAVAANKNLIPWIQTMYQRGSEVASLCLGAFLLGSTGIMDGKKCSTHWAYMDTFRQLYPSIEVADGAVITDEGRLYSSGGANSIWNLLLYLLEKYTDRETAILASKFFAIDISRNSQADFTIFTGQKDHNDPEILRTQLLMEEKFSDKISVEDLADAVNVSRRSFERRFKTATNNTPIEYMQRLRVEAAKRSFEGSRKNVSEVMMDVGYTDTKAFRDVFRKVTGLSPIEYRNKYNKIILKEKIC